MSPTIVANGIPIYYQESGAGEPVLWIQGLGADHTAWFGQISALSQSFRCVVYDNRDVGRSGAGRSEYTVRDLADDAADLLDQLELGPAHVVGLSMGGSIAQELALNHPSSVKSLTLVSAAMRPDARLRHLLSAWADIYPKIETLDFYRQAMPWLLSYRFFERPRAVEAMLRYAANHPQDPAGFLRQVRAGTAHDIVERVSRITLPTMVVAGEEDILVPIRLSRALAGAIPGAIFSAIPQAGHIPNIEQTATFNRLVHDFLNRA